MLNSALRDHAHPENLEAFLPYLKLLLKALNKLPLIRQNVYRGVNMDLHEEYNQLQGRAFRWWAFSSTTQRESQACAFLGQTGEYTLFKIDGVGVDIAPFSAFPHESEVLLWLLLCSAPHRRLELPALVFDHDTRLHPETSAR